MICALLIAFTLSFFTDLFFYVPKTVLAAIIISAVLRLIDIKYAIRLYKSRKDEFAVLVLTFILTLFVGIIQGIFLVLFYHCCFLYTGHLNLILLF